MIRMFRRRPQADDTGQTHVVSPDAAPPADAAHETTQSEPDSANIAAADSSGDDAQDDSPDDAQPGATAPEAKSAVTRWQRVVAYALLPGLAMLIAGGAGYLKWIQMTARETQSARVESVQTATESTIKILSYNPDSVEHDLDAARDRLTGTFRNAYTQLTHDVVIPGSKDKKISAVATVPAATSISANPNHAVVMVFVNQTIMVGNDPPSNTASTVKVTLDKQDNRWLISDFTPI